METAVYLALFIPLLGFLCLLFSAFKINRSAAALIACTAIFVSFICFVGLLYSYHANQMAPQLFTLYQWIDFPGLETDFNIRIDPLSLLMGLIITGVGFLIHVYSIGYMDHEEDYARYFACLNFFVFAMLLLVMAGNLLLLFVGWEGVGLASYLLIGFWYHKPAAAAAAVKAFVMNRIGDCGLLIGLLLTFYLFGTSDIHTVSQQAGKAFAIGAPLMTLLTMLYFFGATGKSAQLPLQTWLPDAMEGPTPVSALIHAATMVTAGVYLIVRMNEVYDLAPATQMVVGVIGAATSLYAAVCALGQTDLKRVLAYSTVSQLGLMFLACGAGAYYAAMFHLTTHAFIKALLFLSAGNVVHMMHGNTEMGKMGGLSKIFPITNWLFIVGVLALSGIPPLAAFFSKDLILDQEFLSGHEVLFIIAFAASILTAFYLTRAYILTFTGSPRMDKRELQTVHEAPAIMYSPVAILAFLAIFGGFLGYTFGIISPLEKFLDEIEIDLPVDEPPGSYVYSLVSLLSIAGGLASVALAAYVYTRFPDRVLAPVKLLKKAFYVDEFYDRLIVRPLEGVAKVIDYFIEPRFFEGSVRAATDGAVHFSKELQQMQSGQIRAYVAWVALGAAALIAHIVLNKP